MFTGLIQQIGKLSRIETISGGLRLFVFANEWQTPFEEGESIAVNGVCVTAVHIQENQFACDVLEETLQKTTLGHKRPGSSLNLERALHLGDAMGGHILTGHVDGTGTIMQRKAVGRDWVFRVACDNDLMKGIVLKGSIACDGVSLTIADLDTRSFAVHIIPYTWAHTALSEIKEGDSVNIEADIIGKYVRRYMVAEATNSKVTTDSLRQAGFSE